MDEDISGIYDDFDNSDLGTQIHNLKERNDTLEKAIEALSKHICTLNQELNQLKSTHETLKKNISELFKTAKTEIARKDRTITELQQKLEDIILRRNRRADNKKRLPEEDVDNSSGLEASIKRAKYEISDDHRASSSEAYYGRKEVYNVRRNADNYRGERHKSSYDDLHHLEHSGKSDGHKIDDIRRGEHRRSSSDDSRYRNDRRDYRSLDNRDRNRPSYYDSEGHRDNSRNRDSSNRELSNRDSSHRDSSNRDSYKGKEKYNSSDKKTSEHGEDYKVSKNSKTTNANNLKGNSEYTRSDTKYSKRNRESSNSTSENLKNSRATINKKSYVKKQKESKTSSKKSNRDGAKSYNTLSDKIVNITENNIIESEGTEVNVENPINSSTEDSDRKDDRASKVNLEVYVKLERSTLLENNGEKAEEIEEHKLQSGNKGKNDHSDNIEKETTQVEEAKETPNADITTNITNGADMNKTSSSQEASLDVLSASAQELQNAINSIKDDSFGTKMSENSMEVIVNTPLPNDDNKIVREDNNIDKISVTTLSVSTTSVPGLSISNTSTTSLSVTNTSITNSSNKRFRSRRRCVISVNE